jgi:transcriptional regulator with PAS, ATPase and Fis domain
LIETELFGHERGAFTGALKQKIGRFELANGGTVFLNEVSEISFQTQLKLLRVLEEEKFERVGGTKTVSVDIRLIAATNRNLEEAVKEGKFRQDLYYRLNVVRIDIPPLRERREDIKSFVYHFLKEFNSKFGTQIYDLPDDVWSVLESYDWPGNVRELENAIQRAVALAKNNVIDINDLPNEILKSYKYNMESTLNDNELPESLNSQQKKLWNWMKDHKQPITTKIYMDITNRSREEARRDFNDLVNKGFLKREGKGRNTEYYFTKNSSR